MASQTSSVNTTVYHYINTLFYLCTVYFSPKESNTQKMGSWSHHCLIRVKVAAQNRDQILHINAESVSEQFGLGWPKHIARLLVRETFPTSVGRKMYSAKANCQKKKQLHGPRVLLTIWVKAVVLLLWSEDRNLSACKCEFSAASQPRCCEARAEVFFCSLSSRDV